MSLPKLLVTRNQTFPVDEATLHQRLSRLAEVVYIDVPFDFATAAQARDFEMALVGAAALFLRPGRVTARALRSARKLKVIAVHGAGVDQVDVEAATRMGIYVTNAPGANAQAVAELTLGLMLCWVRRIPWAVEQVRDRKGWDEGRFLGTELSGKTLGVVGLGQVGRRVARQALALGMGVLAYDPYVPAEVGESLGAPLIDLKALLSKADVVSIHVPLTEETRHLFGESEFRAMKETALLVNTSRARVVEMETLRRALGQGLIAGAALDVFDPEPPPPDEPLLAMENVLVTPHMGGSTRECLQAIASVAAADIARVLQGRPPLNAVNEVKGS